MKRINAKLQFISAACNCPNCIRISDFSCFFDVNNNQKIQCQNCGYVFTLSYISDGIHKIEKEITQTAIKASKPKNTVKIQGSIPPAACKQVKIRQTSVRGVTPPAMKKTGNASFKAKKDDKKI